VSATLHSQPKDALIIRQQLVFFATQIIYFIWFSNCIFLFAIRLRTFASSANKLKWLVWMFLRQQLQHCLVRDKTVRFDGNRICRWPRRRIRKGCAVFHYQHDQHIWHMIGLKDLAYEFQNSYSYEPELFAGPVAQPKVQLGDLRPRKKVAAWKRN